MFIGVREKREGNLPQKICGFFKKMQKKKFTIWVCSSAESGLV